MHRDENYGKIWLSWEKSTKKILIKFDMKNVKLVDVPLVSHFKLSPSLCPSTKEEKDCMSHVPYANVVGSLINARYV